MKEMRKQEQSQEKKPYNKPQLVAHGNVEQLTQQNDDGFSGGPPIVFAKKHK